jgi:hypothetical protein
MLENGFGEHNIQGIGDKHIPLIHNVTNTDVVCAISDVATDELDVLWNTDQGREYLSRSKGIDDGTLDALGHFGFSSTCNLLAAIKTAKLLDLGADDAVITVATDGGAMYPSERAKTIARRYRGDYSRTDAAQAFGQHLAHVSTDHMIDMTEADRRRIFNLGYFTWVEQQGIALADFDRRRSQAFWRGLHDLVPQWDEMITAFNRDSGMAAAA